MRYMFLIFYLCIMTSANAQSVLGIDIKTTKTKYVSAISKVKKEYGTPKKHQDYYMYENVKFADIEGCEFRIYFNNENDSITSIKIRFPHKSYSEDCNLFYVLNKQLKEKYGEGKQSKISKMSGMIKKQNSQRGFFEYEWENPKILLMQNWDNASHNERDSYVTLMYITGVQSSRITTVNPDL